MFGYKNHGQYVQGAIANKDGLEKSWFDIFSLYALHINFSRHDVKGTPDVY